MWCFCSTEQGRLLLVLAYQVDTGGYMCLITIINGSQVFLQVSKHLWLLGTLLTIHLL